MHTRAAYVLGLATGFGHTVHWSQGDTDREVHTCHNMGCPAPARFILKRLEVERDERGAFIEGCESVMHLDSHTSRF